VWPLHARAAEHAWQCLRWLTDLALLREPGEPKPRSFRPRKPGSLRRCSTP